MVFTNTDEARAFNTNIGAPGYFSVQTEADRDRIGGNGVLRPRDLVEVIADATLYRAITAGEGVSPTFAYVGSLAGRVVVRTVAERDALTPKTGERCKVLRLSAEFEWSGAAWVKIDAGNPARLTSLASIANAITLHVDLAGDDEDAGTEAAPYLTTQRAVDEIPVGAAGYVFVQLGAGAFDAPDFSRLRAGAGGLQIIFIGERTPIESVEVTGATTPATNSAGASLKGVRRQTTADPFTTSIDEQSHWLFQAFAYDGEDFPLTYTPVGTSGGGTLAESDGPGSILSVLGPADILVGFGDVDICAFSTQIQGRVDNVSRRHDVVVSYAGVEFVAANIDESSCIDCTASNCLATGDLFFYGRCGVTLVHRGAGDITIDSPENQNVFLLCATGEPRLEPNTHLREGAGYQLQEVGLVSRATGSAESLRVGNIGKVQCSISNLRFCDILSTRSGPAALIRNAVVRVSGDTSEGFSIEPGSASHVASMQHGARLTLSADNVEGETSDVCFELISDASVDGTANQTNLTSALGASAGVKLGSAPSVALASADAFDGVSLTRKT